MQTAGYDRWQMNHCPVKSVEAFAIRKLRGNVNDKADKYNAGNWALQDRNEVADDTMLRYAAARRPVFEGLVKDRVLARLQEAALPRAQARLAAFRAPAAHAPFAAAPAAASAVPITRAAAEPPRPRDPQAIVTKMKDL